jgi:hypothetical protein
MWNDFPSFFTYIFLIFPFFTPGKRLFFEISEMTTHTPMNRARDIWWTLDFASAILSPGVNSRGGLVPSHGASRRRLGDKSAIRCINKIRKSVKIFARSEIRTIFSVQSDDPKTYSPPPSISVLWSL